jgi:hypothetical protein
LKYCQSAFINQKFYASRLLDEELSLPGLEIGVSVIVLPIENSSNGRASDTGALDGTTFRHTALAVSATKIKLINLLCLTNQKKKSSE